MISRLNIFTEFSRKACCVIFILLISISFSFGGTPAKSCKGGSDCASCIELAHSHVPGAVADMENNGCRPGEKTGTCGFEAGRIADEFNGIALIVRSDHYESSGIFAAVSDLNDQPNPSRELRLQFDSPDIDGAVPIYLLNDSLLC
jgi:hypothetical protein